MKKYIRCNSVRAPKVPYIYEVDGHSPSDPYPTKEEAAKAGKEDFVENYVYEDEVDWKIDAWEDYVHIFPDLFSKGYKQYVKPIYSILNSIIEPGRSYKNYIQDVIDVMYTWYPDMSYSDEAELEDLADRIAYSVCRQWTKDHKNDFV